MTEHDDRLPMHQMLEHAREAVEMIHGRTRAELQTNRMLQLALVHLVQTVGEAATRVSAAGRARYSEIPWGQAITTRHRHGSRLRHGSTTTWSGTRSPMTFRHWWRLWSELWRASPTDGREHRPAHRQRPLRGAGAALAVRSREPHVQPGSGPAAGGLRGGHAGLEVLRRPGALRRAAAGQPHPASGPGVAGGGVSRRHGDDPAAAPALARSRGLGRAPVLLLPARGDRDADLADGGAGRRASGDRCPGRWRALHAALRQDGHRLGQDARHGHGHRVAYPQPGGEPSGFALLEARARDGAGAHGEEPPGGARAVRLRQLLRPVQHGPVGAARAAAPGAGAGAQLARPQLGERGAARPKARRGQARRQERRRLCQGSARRHGLGLEHPRHQRRGAPCLARAGGVEAPRRGEGRHRGGHALDRRARPHPSQPGPSRLLRLLGHALRALRQGKLGGGPLRLGRERLQPERRHRVGAGEDAAGGRPGRWRARRQDLPVEALPHLPVGARRPEPQGGGRTTRSPISSPTPTTSSARTGWRRPAAGARPACPRRRS